MKQIKSTVIVLVGLLVISINASCIKAAGTTAFNKISAFLIEEVPEYNQAWLEINLDTLQENRKEALSEIELISRKLNEIDAEVAQTFAELHEFKALGIQVLHQDDAEEQISKAESSELRLTHLHHRRDELIRSRVRCKNILQVHEKDIADVKAALERVGDQFTVRASGFSNAQRRRFDGDMLKIKDATEREEIRQELKGKELEKSGPTLLERLEKLNTTKKDPSLAEI